VQIVCSRNMVQRCLFVWEGGLSFARKQKGQDTQKTSVCVCVCVSCSDRSEETHSYRSLLLYAGLSIMSCVSPRRLDIMSLQVPYKLAMSCSHPRG